MVRRDLVEEGKVKEPIPKHIKVKRCVHRTYLSLPPSPHSPLPSLPPSPTHPSLPPSLPHSPFPPSLPPSLPHSLFPPSLPQLTLPSFPPQRQRRKLVRSVSNPDLLSEALDLQESSGTNGSVAGDKMANLPHSSSHSPLVVTFPENTTESAADAMEVFLQRSTSHSVSSPFRPLAAVLSKARSRGKNAVRGKKGRKQFASLDDMNLPEEPSVSEPEGGGGEGGGGGGGGGSGPSSPLVGRKGSHSNVGIFKRARGSLLHHLMPHEKQATPPADFLEGQGEASDTQSLEELSLNGEGAESRRKKKKKKHSSSDVDKHQPRPFISSPLPRESSGSELRNEDLRSLVLPVPKPWSMCGYLWLRMRTQNNRYAWTHIVRLGLKYENMTVWEYGRMIISTRESDWEGQCLASVPSLSK